MGGGIEVRIGVQDGCPAQLLASLLTALDRAQPATTVRVQVVLGRPWLCVDLPATPELSAAFREAVDGLAAATAAADRGAPPDPALGSHCAFRHRPKPVATPQTSEVPADKAVDPIPPAGMRSRHRLVDQPRATIVPTGIPARPPARPDAPEVVIVEPHNTSARAVG